MNAYVYWVCGFKMSENQQKVSKSGEIIEGEGIKRKGEGMKGRLFLHSFPLMGEDQNKSKIVNKRFFSE